MLMYIAAYKVVLLFIYFFILFENVITVLCIFIYKLNTSIEFKIYFMFRRKKKKTKESKQILARICENSYYINYIAYY
jgi:hypothetical protein